MNFILGLDAEGEIKMAGFDDPNHKGNSDKYHTGKECITDGCSNRAGTQWSPYWCFKCNVERINKINEQFKSVLGELVTRKKLNS